MKEPRLYGQKPWTKEEDLHLLRLYHDKLGTKRIAEILSRGFDNVKNRLHYLRQTMVFTEKNKPKKIYEVIEIGDDIRFPRQKDS